MRDILFRGKRKDNGEWVEGYYVRFGWCGKEKDYIIPFYASACTPIEVIPETVGQYTGLKDKNGVEIYEGDIARVGRSEFLFEVGFSQEYVQFKIFAVNRNISASMNRDIEYTVIGNIHDNPELMKGGVE